MKHLKKETFNKKETLNKEISKKSLIKGLRYCPKYAYK